MAAVVREVTEADMDTGVRGLSENASRAIKTSPIAQPTTGCALSAFAAAAAAAPAIGDATAHTHDPALDPVTVTTTESDI